MRKQSLLHNYLDLLYFYDQDKGVDEQSLARRDRQIGLALSNRERTQFQRITHWLNTRRQDPSRVERANWERLIGITRLFLILLGLCCGFGLTQAVLFYDGDQPVNVLRAFLVLIGPQCTMLAVWGITTIPSPLRERIGTMFLIFNPGYLLLSALQQAKTFRTDPGSTEALRNGIGSAIWFQLVIALSQRFALFFNFGILCCLFFLAFSSDLAFGWNTTLSFTAAQLHLFTDWISLPWRFVFSAAVPSLELIEVSRYYRLDDLLSSTPYPNLHQTEAQFAYQLGQWWLFLFAAVVVYGLLPRMITTFWSSWILRQHLYYKILNHPTTERIVQRMTFPFVTTQTPTSEKRPSHHPYSQSILKKSILLNAAYPVILWSQADIAEQQLQQLDISTTGFYVAGGTSTAVDDLKMAKAIGSASPQGVVIVVKGWEAPLLEFRDFTQHLRNALPHGSPIVVLLTPLPGERVPTIDLNSWETLLSQNDDALYVEPIR